jgi:uncharacterized protein (TIGR02246 family)
MSEQRQESSAVAEEEATVRGLYVRMNDGWNRGDGNDAAAVFAEDGEMVSGDGTYWNGRSEIAKYLTRALTGPVRGSRLVATVLDVRFLRPDVALMRLRADFVPLGASEPAPERRAVHSILAARDAGKWHVALFQATRILSPSAQR